MNKIYTLLAFALFVTLPCYVQSQIPTANPAGTTVTLYKPPLANPTEVATDAREIGFGGVVYNFSNTAWPACTNWGLPKAGVNLVNGSSGTSGCGANPTYSQVALSTVVNNVATYTGNTTYIAYTAAGTTNNYIVPIRLVITIVDNSGTAIPIQQTANHIFVPVPIGSGAFRVMVQMQAQGPSSSVAPFAVYAPAIPATTGTTNTNSYTCADYSGLWVGAIQLFNCLQTVDTRQICTTYPGTANNYQFLLGTSTCGLSTSGQSVNSESVQFCQDGSISFTVNQGSCTSWTARLWNNNYSNNLRTWPKSMGNPVNWTAVNPGSYHVVIEDQTGTCAQRLDITINEGAPCHVNINNPGFSPPSVAGCSDASINASIDAFVCGNTWNATLYDNLDVVKGTWTPPGSAILWNNLPSGNYRIAVTSNSTCNQEANVTVTAGPPCQLTIQNVQDSVVNCGNNTITADIAALTCGNVWAAYLYNSDYSQVVQSSSSPTNPIVWINVALGTYHIVATDFANCQDTVDVTLTCSDNDPCTNDSCTGGCTHTFKCEDNNPCTADFCQPGGVCQNNPIICNDADPCTNDACVNGNCVATPVNCADNNPCTDDLCFNGNCTHTPKVCNDNNACTNDFCSAGNCVFQPTCILNDNNPCTDDFCVNRTCLHVQKNCDDANTCTVDFCDGTGTCQHTPTCTLDDGDPCTTDQCLNGTCAHIQINCNDNNSCTSDRCANGSCVNSEICTVDDGNPCTIDQCVNGQCLHTPVNCSDSNPCTADACDTTGNCIHTPFCPSDGNPCTIDSCSNGLCLYPLKNCNDGFSCTVDFCDSTGTCVNQELCVIDDNDPCTTDLCFSGQCIHQPANCNDGDACTIDSCDGSGACFFPPKCLPDGDACTIDLCVLGQCLYLPVDCDDADLCTTDSCDSLGSCSNTAMDCDDLVVCTDDVCENGVCTHQNTCPCTLDSECDDSNPCTLDSCLANSCDYSSAIDCDDSNPCTDDYCVNGSCINDTINCSDQNACTIDSCDGGTCLHSDMICDDSDLCTNDTCVGGVCVFGSIICNDGNVCTIDSCDNGNCVFNPVVCIDDGNLCTNDTCINGSCLSLPMDCDDNDLCTVDTCINGACVHETITCPDDGDLCTIDFCENGLCTSEPAICDDQDQCTTDNCDTLTGCVNDPICDNDDADACTNDTCIGGQCLNIPITCNDSITCTNDFCDNGLCEFQPLCDLDDGEPCTVDTCIGGGCIHIPKDCDDHISCTNDFCDTLGNCINDYLCELSDGDPCTRDTCGNGDCLHFPITCNDNNACTDDACQNGVCVFDPLCVLDDNNPCTNDFCIGGQCLHQNIFCNDGLQCTDDFCDSTGTCVYPPIVCDDGNPCTNDSCLSGSCINVPIPNCSDPCDVMVCTDGNLCTTDTCINATCVYPLINCNDNDPCTSDSCNTATGNCSHIVVGNCNLTISGQVKTETGVPVRSVTVKLTGTGNQIVTTGTDGQFTFGAIQGDSCTIAPSKANDTITNNGVSTLDLILIQRQILAVQQLGSPYKKIAADVNNSQTVSTLDIILIRAVILAIAQTYPNGRLWAFVSSDFVFADSVPPFPFENYRTYPNMTADQTNQDFIGMKLGDVNNSWNPNIAKLETVGEVQFAIDEYDVKQGDEIIIPVKVKDFKNVTGFQFTLSWNPAVMELLEVNNRSLENFYGMNSTAEGFLTTSWFDEMTKDITLNDGDAVFDLKFKVTGAAGSYSEIAINSELTETEAYNQNLDLLNIVSGNGMVKVGEGSGSNVADSYNLRVQPNPFSNVTNIIFSIPQDETVSIIIYDLVGKEIKHILGQFEAGEYSIEWAGDDNAGKSLTQGLYHVRMVAGDHASVQKTLLIR